MEQRERKSAKLWRKKAHDVRMRANRNKERVFFLPSLNANNAHKRLSCLISSAKMKKNEKIDIGKKAKFERNTENCYEQKEIFHQSQNALN